jgi:hypothetical protein
MGLFGPSAEEKEKRQKEAQATLERAKKVKVTTGDLNLPYEIIGPVFDLGQDQGGFMGQLLGTGGSPYAAFKNSEVGLQSKAAEVGGDYVIHAVFNQRVAVSTQKTVTGSYNQVLEIFAYGTAVKLK